jgi:hypothetical protein
MKLIFITPALVAFLGLAFSGSLVTAQAQADTTAAVAPAQGTPTEATKVKKTPYSGKLTAIDTTANTITVQTAKESLTLTITDKTKYKGGKALSDFAVGDAVTGSYMKDPAGTMTAASLHKKKMKAAAAQ